MKKLSPRQLRRLQARMLGNLGLNVKELGRADRVIIRFADKEIILEGPNILEMKVENESIYQVIGGERVEGEAEEVRREKYEPEEEDVMLVVAQTGASEEEARSALIESQGDLAKAILMLKATKS